MRLDLMFGYDIFMSYSSKDRLWAIAIEKLLKLGRFRVFRDDTELHTGEHLDRLLNEARRSTMLMVLVSDHSMQSDWVYRELEAHVERPRKKWRIAPVFLDAKYPRELPERFKLLGDFHGVPLPFHVARLEQVPVDRPLLADLTSEFGATRRATLQLVAAAALAVLVAAVVGFLILRNQLNSARDELLKKAELDKASSRFELAEADLARASVVDDVAVGSIDCSMVGLVHFLVLDVQCWRTCEKKQSC